MKRIEGECRARLIHAFQVHVRSERHVIDDYATFLDRTTDRGIRFLLEQILADERRHHELFIALANAMPEAVSAASIRHASGYYRADDNFCATIRFSDGSLANLIYTALGAENFPKERLDVFFDGKVYAIDNFTRLEVHGGSAPQLATPNPAKGHEEELIAFARAIQIGGAWPIALWQQAAATRVALQVQSQLG